MNCLKIAGSVGCLCAALLAGCSGGDASRPEVVPVSGTVLYKGNPVEGASVAFWGEGAPRAATGVTDAEGKFKLSMFGANDGTVPGVNKITVSKVDAPPPAATTSPDTALSDPTALTNMYTATMANAKKSGPKYLVPQKYGDVSTSPLQETVTKGQDNTFVLQLTD